MDSNADFWPQYTQIRSQLVLVPESALTLLLNRDWSSAGRS